MFSFPGQYCDKISNMGKTELIRAKMLHYGKIASGKQKNNLVAMSSRIRHCFGPDKKHTINKEMRI